MFLDSIDRTLQEVLSLAVPNQRNSVVAILLLDVLLDSFHLSGSMSVCYIDNAVFFVILVEDRLHDILVSIVLFQHLSIHDHTY